MVFSPDVGTLSYDGFIFPPAVKMVARAEPQINATGRATKYTRYRFEIETILFPGADDADPNPLFPATLASTDGTLALGDPGTHKGMLGLRHKLTAKGKRLVVTSKGFGDDLDIDTVRQPVFYGPDPELMVFRSLGANQAIHLVWSVGVTLADCIPNVSPVNRIADWGYDEEWAINESGLTQRTIDGFVEVQPAIAPSGRIIRSADWWRDRLAIEVPEGFERVQSYPLSMDRRILRFRIVDTEIDSPLPYPEGTVRPQVRHRVRSLPSILSDDWEVSIQARIPVAHGKPKYLAWLAFLAVVKSRMKAADDHSSAAGITRESTTTNPLKPDTDVLKDQPRAVQMLGPLEIEDDVYGNTMSFSFSWTILTGVGTILEASGMWEPVGSRSGRDTWEKYRASMSRAWSPRGEAQMHHDDASDVLITICTQRSGNVRERPIRINAVNERDIFTTRCPEPKDSWMCFESYAELITATRVVCARGIGGSVTEKKVEAYTLSRSDTAWAESLGFEGSPGDNGDKRIVHRRGTPFVTVRFWGVALRIGYEIPRPFLLSYGGAKATEVDNGYFDQFVISKQDDCPIYAARWDDLYDLEELPSGKLTQIDPDLKHVPKCQ